MSAAQRLSRDPRVTDAAWTAHMFKQDPIRMLGGTPDGSEEDQLIRAAAAIAANRMIAEAQKRASRR